MQVIISSTKKLKSYKKNKRVTWNETDVILNNTDLLIAIEKAEKDIQNGDFITLSQLETELELHV